MATDFEPNDKSAVVPLLKLCLNRVMKTEGMKAYILNFGIVL
jgi:hypothetical protein